MSLPGYDSKKRRGRPEAPIDPSNGSVAEFAVSLRELRDQSGLTIEEVAKRAHYSRAAISGAQSGKQLPTWELTEAFVSACRDDPAKWEPRWKAAQSQDLGPLASDLAGAVPAASAAELQDQERPAPPASAEDVCAELRTREFLDAPARRARHKRLLTRAAAVSLVLLAIGTTVFIVLRSNAQRERTAAAANDVASESQAASDWGRAAALAATAYQIDPTSAAYASELAAIGKEGDVSTIQVAAPTPVTGLAVSSDGRDLAVFGSGGTATVVDITHPARPRITGPLPSGSGLKPGPTNVEEQMLTYVGGLTGTSGGNTPQSATPTDGSDPLSGMGDAPGFLQAMSLLTGMSNVEASLLSPDGSTLAAAAAGQGVTLYNVSNGNSPFSTPSDDSFASLQVAQPIDSMAFTSDGSVLAIAAGNSVLLWSMPPVITPGQLIQQVCSRGDELTRQEWSQYVPSYIPYEDICAL
jgi:transcriptional regulator with XRE-family HTH domain